MGAHRVAIGQEALATRLARHAEEGSLAHALLLTGVPGRGGLALTLAPRQAVALPTEQRRLCTCPSCQQHDQLQHPDLHFTFPGGQTGRKGQGAEQRPTRCLA